MSNETKDAAPPADLARELAECRAKNRLANEEMTHWSRRAIEAEKKLARFEAAEKGLPPENEADWYLQRAYDSLRASAVAKIAELEAKLEQRKQGA